MKFNPLSLKFTIKMNGLKSDEIDAKMNLLKNELIKQKFSKVDVLNNEIQIKNGLLNIQQSNMNKFAIINKGEIRYENNEIKFRFDFSRSIYLCLIISILIFVFSQDVFIFSLLIVFYFLYFTINYFRIYRWQNKLRRLMGNVPQN